MVQLVWWGARAWGGWGCFGRTEISTTESYVYVSPDDVYLPNWPNETIVTVG